MKKMSFIIRWSDVVKFESGKRSNMKVMSGKREEVEEYADRIAKEQNVKVEFIG